MTENIVAALIGSGVIAALVSGLFSFADKRNDNVSKHIVEQREKWRETLRGIAEEIQQCNNVKTLRKSITKLKTRINAYGQIEKEGTVLTKYFHEDSHIWDEIRKIDDLKNDNMPSIELSISKDKLVRYISMLLKNDWERSKKEAITASDYWAYFSSAIIFTGLYALYYFLSVSKDVFPEEIKLFIVLIFFSIALLFVTKELIKKLTENNAFRDDYSIINVFLYFFLRRTMPTKCGKTAKGYSIVYKVISIFICAILFLSTIWIVVSQINRIPSAGIISPIFDMLVLLTIFLTPTITWVFIIYNSITTYVHNNAKERKAILDIMDGPIEPHVEPITVYEKMKQIEAYTFKDKESDKLIN